VLYSDESCLHASQKALLLIGCSKQGVLSSLAGRVVYNGLHHVGLLVEDLERSLEFYMGVLGLEQNNARPDSKLPYRGAWLWIGRCFHHVPDLLKLEMLCTFAKLIVRRRK